MAQIHTEPQVYANDLSVFFSANRSVLLAFPCRGAIRIYGFGMQSAHSLLTGLIEKTGPSG